MLRVWSNHAPDQPNLTTAQDGACSETSQKAACRVAGTCGLEKPTGAYLPTTSEACEVSMFRCTSCGTEFSFDPLLRDPSRTLPGQCPVCGGWSEIRCIECGHVDSAAAFLANQGNCPECGATSPIRHFAEKMNRLACTAVLVVIGLLVVAAYALLRLMGVVG